jgi:hypothetical protein
MNVQDPTKYFLNDEEACIKLLEEKIQEVVRENPGVTTKSVLQRMTNRYSHISEGMKSTFTKALCKLIETDAVKVCGFKEPKDQPFESQLVCTQLTIPNL